MLSEKLPKEANDGFVLPGNWEKAGKLKTRHAEAENGWLLVGLEQEQPGADANVASIEAQPEPAQPALEQTANVSP